MSKEKSLSELEVITRAIIELDRMRFAEELAPEDRLSIEQRMVALRETERLYLQKKTQESLRKLETEIETLKTLRTTFEQQWKSVSHTQSVLDKINQVIHSLLEVSSGKLKL